MQSFCIAVKHADILRNAGYVPFVPFYPFWNMVSPREITDFQDMALAFLRKCDAVIMVPGGYYAGHPETELAASLNIPVFASVYDLLTSDCK